MIADNRFHRIHHSVEPRHFDRNVGEGTSVWKQLFGMAYLPAENEWTATGVVGEPEARSITHYLCRPFRAAAGNLDTRDVEIRSRANA